MRSPNVDLQAYAAQVRKEFIEGSAIHPALFDLAIEVRAELESSDWDEPEGYPIHEALGWKEPSRWYQTRIPHEFGAGAFFQDTRVGVWQVKPKNPRIDKKRNRVVKYETPKGLRAAYFPPVPKCLQAKILLRQGWHGKGIGEPTRLTDPSRFYDDVVIPENLDTVLGEGGKKGLCGISHGYPVVSLPGVFNGYSKDPYALRPDVAELATEGRTITLAFDQDALAATRHKVNLAIARLGRLLIERGVFVRVATWDHSQGKGLDDLVVQSGEASLHRAIADALPFAEWERRFKSESIRWRTAHGLGDQWRKTQIAANDLSGLSSEFIKAIPTTGVVALKSPTGTGKTKLARLLLEEVDKVIAPGHRESLQRGLGRRLGLDYLGDLQRVMGGWMKGDGSGWATRVAMCMDSIFKIDMKGFAPGTYDLFLDEADQGLPHLLMGATCGKDGKRPMLQARLIELIKGARRIILASAGLSDRELDLVLSIRGDESAWVLENRPTMTGYTCSLYMDSPEGGDRAIARGTVTAKLIHALRDGKRCIIHTDTKAASRMLQVLGDRVGKLSKDQILRFDGDTSPEPLQRSFADDPDGFLATHDIRLLIASPSLTSGVSIEGDHFDIVFGYFEGKTILPADAMQSMNRYRRPVQRCVFAAAYGLGGALAAYRAEEAMTREHERARMIDGILPSMDFMGRLDMKSPAAQYVAECRAEHYRAMGDFGLHLRAHLEGDGHQVTVCGDLDKYAPGVKDALSLLASVRYDVREQILRHQASAKEISDEFAQKLRDQKSLTYEQRLQLNKYDVIEFYGIKPQHAHMEFMRYDHDGDTRQGLRFLRDLLLDGSAIAADEGRLDRLQSWDQPIAPHDLPRRELRRWAAHKLGIKDALLHAIEATESDEGWDDETPWVRELQDKLLCYGHQVKLIFGFMPSRRQTPCQFFGMLLRALTKTALKTKSRQATDAYGERFRIYTIDRSYLHSARRFITRLIEKRVENSTNYSLCTHPLTKLLTINKGVCSEAHDPHKLPGSPLEPGGTS